ncbi:undecaprenyl-phosphate glucose phosphotransferase [Vibrio algicola]|uniref:Undecaprenyl-phosphate glucose phosphotransferase n=1 Tax=Vibrio algicola TaxID=2662262 RepID=A0A5Q0TII6_9VIBR|nr:undecaprenyl-phosphate glucose phosphotransferase [Vibrio algicola]
MSREAIKIANDGFSILVKIVDFSIINLTLIGLLKLNGLHPSIVDVSAGLLFSAIFLLSGEYTGFYKLGFESSKMLFLKKFIAIILTSLILMSLVKTQFIALPCIKDAALTRELLWIVYSVSFFLIGILRLSLLSIKTAPPKIAILGLTAGGLSVERGLIEKYGKDIIQNIAFYDDRGPKRFGYMTKSAYKGGIAALLELAKKNEIDEVYIALPLVARDRIRKFMHILSDTTVDTMIVPDLYTYNLSNIQLKSVGQVQTFSVFASPFEGLGGVIKRGIDLVVGSVITLIILPVLAGVAVGVKLSSPGPVLFKQDRYGLGGKKIKVWKFRSMKVMENTDVVVQATKGDPRVTKFGAFIRRTSLDELPQFINVLQGTMSIVGPRPHAVSHNEQYRKIVDNYMVRHKVKPGITGLAQIRGFRGETDTLDKMAKRIQYDIRYMQNWTPLYDLKIIFMTIFKGFMSETAY